MQPDCSVWNCVWGHALKRFPGINHESRVSYPGPRFLSGATWPSLPKKHFNGLNQTKPQINSHGVKNNFDPDPFNLHRNTVRGVISIRI